MGKLKWYKRDPSKALKGMMKLNLEQRGAYNTILDLIYSHDNELDDDDHVLAAWLRVDVRVARRLKAELIAAGKLYTDCGYLKNKKADEEVSDGLHRIASATTAGIKSGDVRRAKSVANTSENNNLNGTSVPTIDELTLDTTTRTKTKKKEEALRDSGGKEEERVWNEPYTIKDQTERIKRFHDKVFEQMLRSGIRDGRLIIAAACDKDSPLHERSLAICKAEADKINKKWPYDWD